MLSLISFCSVNFFFPYEFDSERTSWPHTQAQMVNGIQLGFPIDIILQKDT